MATQLWNLDVENARRIDSQYNDAASRFYHLFDWAENFQRREIEIESPTLKRLLYRWYLHQDVKGGPPELIDQIGYAVSAACRQLNANGWSNLPVSKAFILYTNCCSDDAANFGLEQCVTPQWKQYMENKFGSTIEELLTPTLPPSSGMGMDMGMFGPTP